MIGYLVDDSTEIATPCGTMCLYYASQEKLDQNRPTGWIYNSYDGQRCGCWVGRTPKDPDTEEFDIKLGPKLSVAKAAKNAGTDPFTFKRKLTAAINELTG